MLSSILIIAFFVPALSLFFRAAQRKCLSEFPLFFSYIAYMLISGALVTGLYLWAPAAYPTGAWFRFLMSLLAEFAVLVEISDYIFKPFPAIRKLGRLTAFFVCLGFASVYVIPPLMASRPSSIILLDIAKRLSLTKAVMIIALLAVARLYRIPLGRNISGILLGFAAYLTVNVANFAMAEVYGRALYARTLSIIVPLSYTVCLLIWTVTLWRPEPATQGNRASSVSGEFAEPLPGRLVRMNTALARLFEK